jgi:hypothetical protein
MPDGPTCQDAEDAKGTATTCPRSDSGTVPLPTFSINGGIGVSELWLLVPYYPGGESCNIMLTSRDRVAPSVLE